MRTPTVWSALVAAALALAVQPASAGVDVHIAITPPPIVIDAPPRLVVVPGYPAVRYAPALPYDYFAYGGRYYTCHDGAWFVAPRYGGPWRHVDVVRVPYPVRVVPTHYYRVPPGRGPWHGHPHGMPPGQAKKLYGWRGHGHGHERD